MPALVFRRHQVEVTVAWATLLKLIAFAGLVYVVVKLVPLLGMLFLALLIAITMAPIAAAIASRGFPRWLAVAVCAVILFGSFGLFLVVVSPIVLAQISALIKALPEFKDHILQALSSAGSMRDLADGLLQSPSFSNPEPLLARFMAWGIAAITSLIQFFILLVIAVYLLADGQRIYEWILAFLPERQQKRVAAAAPEIFAVIFDYMGGQLVTSLLCAAYIWTILTVLHVPNALLLAIIGGVCDILPIIGFFLALAPSLAMAFTVSPFAAACVTALYTIYHLVECYVIVPRIYGNRLRLSNLTVLLACLAAGIVGGVVGVIVILPIIASFPVVERMWLRPVFGRDTVEKHDEIEQKAHPQS